MDDYSSAKSRRRSVSALVRLIPQWVYIKVVYSIRLCWTQAGPKFLRRAIPRTNDSPFVHKEQHIGQAFQKHQKFPVCIRNSVTSVSKAKSNGRLTESAKRRESAHWITGSISRAYVVIFPAMRLRPTRSYLPGCAVDRETHREKQLFDADAEAGADCGASRAGL